MAKVRIIFPLFALLFGIAAFHVITMPRFFYSGDNFAPRVEAENWLMTGHLGIDYSLRAGLGTFLDERGQYFYENEQKKEYFSKYGIAYTALYAIPLWAEKVYTGTIKHSRDQLLFINLFQVVLSLLTAIYLYLIASFFTGRQLLRVGFVLASIYGTYLWYYLRAPTHEVFQICSFLAYFYHLVRFLRVVPTTNGSSWRACIHLCYATMWTGLLVLMKPNLISLFIVAGIFALFSGQRDLPVMERIKHNLRTNGTKYFLAMAVPFSAAALILLGSNFYRFGGFFNTGYLQWVNSEGTPIVTFSAKYIPKAFIGFFLTTGNTNAFIHYPVFLFGLFGLRRFIQKNPQESLLVLTIILLNFIAISGFSFWNGEWCYGPRYLITILMIGSLPFIEVMDSLLSLRRNWFNRACLALVILILLWSFAMQVCVNSLNYFVYHRMSTFLSPFQVESIDDYIKSRTKFHRGYLCFDLLAYRYLGKEFYPVKAIKQRALGQNRLPEQNQLMRDFDAALAYLSKPNYFFAE